MKRTFLLISTLAVALLAAGVLPATADDGYGDPAKVYICHFDGHTHPSGEVYWSNGSYELTGDYVIRYEIMRDRPQDGIDACLQNNGGDDVLLVSVNALGSENDMRGHRANALGRIDGVNPAGPTSGYPDGFKGF